MRRRLLDFLFFLVACFAFSFSASAQGVHYTDIALTTAGAGTYLQTLGSNAIINVCPSTDVAIPCTTYSAIYSDKALTMPITQSAGAFHADGLGNIDFWTAPAVTYSVTVTGRGTSGYRKVWDAPIGTVSVLTLVQTPLTTRGDLLTVSGTPALTRLAAPGATDFFLYGDTTGPTWKSFPNCVNALTWSTATHSVGCNSNIGTGTVTSVSISVPSWLSVANNPITSSGTLIISAATGQSSNRVIGTCGAATSFGVCQENFSDLLGNAAVSQMNSGSGANSATVFRGDNTWAAGVVGPWTVSNLVITNAAPSQLTRNSETGAVVLGDSNYTIICISGCGGGTGGVFDIYNNGSRIGSFSFSP